MAAQFIPPLLAEADFFVANLVTRFVALAAKQISRAFEVPGSEPVFATSVSSCGSDIETQIFFPAIRGQDISFCQRFAFGVSISAFPSLRPSTNVLHGDPRIPEAGVRGPRDSVQGCGRRAHVWRPYDATHLGNARNANAARCSPRLKRLLRTRQQQQQQLLLLFTGGTEWSVGEKPKRKGGPKS